MTRVCVGCKHSSPKVLVTRELGEQIWCDLLQSFRANNKTCNLYKKSKCKHYWITIKKEYEYCKYCNLQRHKNQSGVEKVCECKHVWTDYETNDGKYKVCALCKIEMKVNE